MQRQLVESDTAGGAWTKDKKVTSVWQGDTSNDSAFFMLAKDFMRIFDGGDVLVAECPS